MNRIVQRRELVLAGVLAAGLAVLTVPRTPHPAGGPGDGSDPRLEERRVELLARLAGKQAVMRALLRRELTLPEAADRLRELTAGDPRTLAGLRLRHPDAASEEELFCRHATDLVELVMPHDPAAAGAARARLESDLREHRGRGGDRRQVNGAVRAVGN
jgi:hypothetical protein